ncbi:MAG: hypothetical protein KH135_06390 [Firmicutes bacterium]|nr:hypothetical protein [Bacillota bacterium]
MNNEHKFKEYRSQYPDFIYEKFEIEPLENEYKITYFFHIPNLVTFKPTLTIKKEKDGNQIDQSYFKNLVFHIGMVELVSYFKCTCSPNVEIKAGYLNEEQLKFFQKLYYHGLGEFLYTNGIEVEMDELMRLTCAHPEEELPSISYQGVGNLIPVGGGKDSTVSLELLKEEKETNSCFMINPKEVMIACANVAGYDDNDIITVKRVIDKNLLELNKQGYLNGHTPFSAIVAFTSYLCAYLNGKKYIVLSNEASANEATVLGTKINHQYSKTYEFENDFNEYTKKFFQIDIKYFSMLRPLSEFQIGMLFSNYKKFHPIFKSCNVGSKQKPWVWCCDCPKCLFVYSILSPFLYKEELLSIFQEDMFENESLLNTFIELLGYGKTKPFECVGTYSEVRYAISLTIQKLGKQKLPYLLEYYKKHYPLELEHDLIHAYHSIHNLEPHFETIVKKALEPYV